ncbi:unnamed protein product [Trichobilharzia regenti]|nr:unnamed protein product [Trichobilharzia regenti]
MKRAPCLPYMVYVDVNYCKQLVKVCSKAEALLVCLWQLARRSDVSTTRKTKHQLDCLPPALFSSRNVRFLFIIFSCFPSCHSDNK